jgi:hypothetical protein
MSAPITARAANHFSNGVATHFLQSGASIDLSIHFHRLLFAFRFAPGQTPQAFSVALLLALNFG